MKRAGLLAGSVLVMASGCWAVPITFTTGGLTCLNSTNAGACSGGLDNIWNTGDFLSQTFTSTGLGSVSQLSLNLSLYNNLASGQNETWNITINAILVGSLGFTGSGSSVVNSTYSFASIAGAGGGQDYTINFTVASPGVPAGGGTLGLPTTGVPQTGDLATVPEPGTWPVLGIALAAAWSARRRFASR